MADEKAADKDTEAALVALLSRLSDADDPAIADRAIDRYMNRLSDQERLAAFARLTRAMLEDDDGAASDRSDKVALHLRRQG